MNRHYFPTAYFPLLVNVMVTVQLRLKYLLLALNSKVKNNISSLVVTAVSKLSLIRLEAMTIFVTQMRPLMQTFELLLTWVGK